MLRIVTIICFSVNSCWAEIAKKEAILQFTSELLIDSMNISGIALYDKFLVLGSDEGAGIQVLQNSAPNVYVSQAKQLLVLGSDDEELDIEGLAKAEQYIYVVGSHSRIRQKVKQKKYSKTNHKRLATTRREASREQLFRLKLDAEGRLVKDSIKILSLRDIFANHPVLALFKAIPSKENGIDIEGLAVNEKNHELFIGFRGPVLRENFTPVMVMKFADGNFTQSKLKHEIRYLDMGGLGIRGMSRIKDGFLVLGGPVGDKSTPYYLFFWDGKDMVPGKDNPKVSEHIKRVCEIPLPSNTAKAEGVEFLQLKNGRVHVLIVYDGVQNGGGVIFSCLL
jgi:hypothetical protein